MVYTKIYIIAGIKVSDESLKKFLADQDCYFGDPEGLEKEAVFNAWKKYKKTSRKSKQFLFSTGTKLFSFPCCSESTDWLLGYISHTIYRQHISCRTCEEFSACEKCFGQTPYGWYDVTDIFNGPVEIESSKICHNCSSDQVDKVRRCQVCFIDAKPQKKEGYQRKEYFKGGSQLLGVTDPKQEVEIKYFYMLDDCLSCT